MKQKQKSAKICLIRAIRVLKRLLERFQNGLGLMKMQMSM